MNKIVHTAVSREVVLQNRKSVATVSNSFMGNSNLPWLDQSSSCFNAIKGDTMSTYVHGFSFPCG